MKIKRTVTYVYEVDEEEFADWRAETVDECEDPVDFIADCEQEEIDFFAFQIRSGIQEIERIIEVTDEE